MMALADTTIENDLRRQLRETRKVLRNLVNALDSYGEFLFFDDTDTPEALKAGEKLEKRANEARRALG
jgi:hypothetical protein